MNTPFKVILPDGTTTEHHADLIAAPPYERLRDLIVPHLNGRDLEHVTVLHEGERLDMFVDDSGTIDGLPRNEVATAIYRNNWLTQHPGADPEELPAIHGPAILFSRRVWF